MTDPQSASTTTEEPGTMRPIPDGGLRQSMPEWLRRPPAWRDLPKPQPDSPAALEPAANVAQEAPTPQPERSLPDPDTSMIDPRSLVDVADLPQWLQDIAARSTARTEAAAELVAEPDVAQPVSTDLSDTEEAAMADANSEKRLERDPSPDHDVVFEPVDKKKWETPEQETKVYGGGKPSGGMNQMVLIGVIAAAAIVLIILLLMIL